MFPAYQQHGASFVIDHLNSKYQDKRRYQLLDMRQAAQIYDYYYRSERWISICKRAKYQMVFKGGVEVSWGDGLLGAGETEDPTAQRELVSLLQRALDYRDMFGMCPVKVLRHPDGLRKRPTVPEFGTGVFISMLDLRSLQARVLFMPCSELDGKFGDAQQLERNALPVYVWPGSEPDTRSGHFNSRVFTLMSEYLAVEELRSNALDADWENSHPTIFTQARAESKDPTQLTEEEIFGDADEPELSSNEARTYRRNSIRAVMLEQLMHTKNSSLQQPRSEPDSASASSSWKREVDQNTSTVVQRKRKRVWIDNIEALPAGEEMAAQVLSRPRTDLLRWREEYEESVCLQVGLPKRYVTGQMGKFAAEAQQQQDLLRSSVEADRDDAAMFYEWAYERMYREGDNLVVAQKLTDICNHRKTLLKAGKDKQQEQHQQQQQQHVAELRRLQAQKSLWKKIASMPNRASLMFREDSFPRVVDLNALAKAAERGAITRLEEMNLLRSKLTLETIDETHKLFTGPESGGKSESTEKEKQSQQPQQQKEKETEKNDSGNQRQSSANR